MFKHINIRSKHIKLIKYIDWKDIDEPCKGDTFS